MSTYTKFNRLSLAAKIRLREKFTNEIFYWGKYPDLQYLSTWPWGMHVLLLSSESETIRGDTIHQTTIILIHYSSKITVEVAVFCHGYQTRSMVGAQ